MLSSSFLCVLFSVLSVSEGCFTSFLLVFDLLLVLREVSSFHTFIVRRRIASALGDFLLVVPQLEISGAASL